MYPKQYHQDLAKQILNDLQAPICIIKPINALQSYGVIMVTADDLDETLRLILTPNDDIKKMHHRCYKHWVTDNNDTFIVEAYAPSKTMVIDNKPYDPTMRIVFCLSYQQGIITLHVLGGFWKIPLKALNETGTLTEQHITIPFTGAKYVGIPIEEHDMQQVQQALAAFIKPLYSIMLDKREERE